MSSYNTIRDYFGNKQFKGSEIIQSSIMIILGIFLVSGGFIILQDEEIFKKMYEGFETPITVTSVPASGTCSNGSTLYTSSISGPFGGSSTIRVCVSNCSSSETLAYSDESRVSGTTLDINKMIQGTPTSGLKCITDSSSGSTSGATSGSGSSGSGSSGIGISGSGTSGTSGIATSRASARSPLTWTADLPEDLTLTSLQKNISVLRKKSSFNIGLGYTMIAIGLMICLYQLYSLFLT